MEARFASKRSYEIMEALVHVAMLGKSPTGNGLAALVLQNLCSVGLELKNWRVDMPGRAVGAF